MDERTKGRAGDNDVSGLPDSGPLTAREAAAVLGLNERTVRRAIDRGELPATKRAGSFHIAPEDLARYRSSFPLRISTRTEVKAGLRILPSAAPELELVPDL